MKLQLIENFTLEVPTGTDTFDVIKGGLIPENKKILREIELNNDNDIKLAKKMQKDNTKMNRLEERINSLTDLISIIKDETAKIEKIEKRDELREKLYTLQDELALGYETVSQKDPAEIRAKEHIQRRVKADDTNKAKLFKLCEDYGYSIVFDTVLKDIEEGKSKDKKI